MELQLFFYKDLAVHFYYSRESIKGGSINIKRLCLFFPGLPNFIEKRFFEDKVNKDTAFFSVYYYGTWLSGRYFTYSNCKKTIETVIEFAKARHGIKTFDKKNITWKFQNLYLLGYSFSGNLILTTKINKEDVRAVYLYAPLIYLNRHEVEEILSSKEIEDFYKLNKLNLKFLKRGYKNVIKGIRDPSWERYFLGADSSSVINIQQNYPRVFIYHGKYDNKINPLFSQYFNKKYKEKTTLSLINNVGHDLRGLFNLRHVK